MQQLAVPARLARYVRGVRYLPAVGVATDLPPYQRLPDAELELVVRFDAGETSATLIGIQTARLDKPSSGSCAATLLVRFRRGGAHPFFGRPLSQLTDAVVPLDELWSPEAWQLMAAGGSRDVALQRVCAALESLLTRTDVYDPTSARGVQRALAVIAAAPALPQVSALAAELGMSERALRRGFDHVVGLSPKQYLRVVRFRRALKAARRCAQPDWAAIAEQVGYFDQAHMIAEFRELARATPVTLLKTLRSEG